MDYSSDLRTSVELHLFDSLDTVVDVSIEGRFVDFGHFGGKACLSNFGVCSEGS